jgi:1,4-dihydroxy-2-naphthoate octaprenyltransferase
MPPLEPTLAAFANPFARYFAATRPAFLTASLTAAILGLATARHSGIVLDATLATVTLLFAVLAHAGANVLNDYYDALNGTDAANTERIFPFTGGSRFIQNGVLTRAQTRNFGFSLLAAVALAGLWLMAQSAPQLLFIGLLGLLVGWAYSAPPLSLNSRGLGELCIAVGFSLIPIGADFVQRGEFALFPVIAVVSYGLLTANLLYINQFPDRTADISAGKLHWVARLPVTQARWGYVLIAASAYFWLAGAVIMHALPPLALLGMLSAPLSFKAARELLQHAAQPQQLATAIQATIGAMLAHGALVSVALFIA